MTLEFWAGLLAFPVAVIALLLVWALYSVATRAWSDLHVKILQKVDLRENAGSFRLRGTPDPEPRPLYEDAANYLRDALLSSPRIYSFNGLGWVVTLVRDTKKAPVMR